MAFIYELSRFEPISPRGIFKSPRLSVSQCLRYLLTQDHGGQALVVTKLAWRLNLASNMFIHTLLFMTVTRVQG